MLYRLILADPPWSFRNVRTGGSMSSGAAAKYPVLSLADIRALPVHLVAKPDSVLFLWVPVPLLPDGLGVLSAWGYRYKTAVFWDKGGRLGMGYWFRGQVEMCLLGIRGHVKAFRIQKPNFIQSKAREHSRKPDEMYDLIEQTGLEPRLELFARERERDRRGWDCIGAGVNGGEDIRVSLAKMIAGVGGEDDGRGR